jgi:nucleoid DNA-binding protein
MAKGKDNAKAPSKTEIVNGIAESTGLSKKEVTAVFEALTSQIKNSIGRRGPGMFAIPGLCKITVKHRPATKERRGINPFTKEETVFKAKPARNVVKIKPLKALKDMVG